MKRPPNFHVGLARCGGAWFPDAVMRRTIFREPEPRVIHRCVSVYCSAVPAYQNWHGQMGVLRCSSPRMAQPSTAGLWGEAPRRGRAQGCARLDRATRCRVGPAPGPQSPRSGGVLRHPGRPFLWLLSFGRAKESSLPWVSHPQGLISYSTHAPAGRYKTSVA
jgi:hypothetical protein